MSKKFEFTEEVIERDLTNFSFQNVNKKEDIPEFLEKSEMASTLLPLFNSGELRMEEGDNVFHLIQKNGRWSRT